MTAKHKQSGPFKGFDPYEVERAAVGAISIPNPNPANGDGTYAEICSGSLIGYDDAGNGLFLTARHCVWDDDAENEDGPNPHFILNEVVSFQGNLKGPYYQTELAEISSIDDIALLEVINLGWASQPIIPEVLEDEHSLSAGDPVENVSFPLDMGKLEFHGKFVASVFPHFSRSLQNYPQWARTMPVDITIGHGSSGSPLFDSKTHELIGVMVGTSGDGDLMIAEPTSAVLSMLADLHSFPQVWVQAHLPQIRFRVAPKDREHERSPFIPGLLS